VPRATDHTIVAAGERLIRVTAPEQWTGESHCGQYTSATMRPAEQMRSLNLAWIQQAAAHRHLFRQEWLGERFFHLPGDVLALQHLFWAVRPEVAVLTGVAAGGGPIFAASMLELLGDGQCLQSRSVIAIDPVVHDSVRARFAEHTHARRISLIEGSTIDDGTLARVREQIAGRGPVLVILDHNHTHAHVLRELELYSTLVSPGSYMIVLDTIMEDMPDDYFAGKPYGKGNNPGTALREFLATDTRFEVDHDIEDRVLMTLAPGGFLRRRP
jgi:cephalosporin hydroxylase